MERKVKGKEIVGLWRGAGGKGVTASWSRLRKLIMAGN